MIRLRLLKTKHAKITSTTLQTHKDFEHLSPPFCTTYISTIHVDFVNCSVREELKETSSWHTWYIIVCFAWDQRTVTFRSYLLPTLDSVWNASWVCTYSVVSAPRNAWRMKAALIDAHCASSDTDEQEPHKAPYPWAVTACQND